LEFLAEINELPTERECLANYEWWLNILGWPYRLSQLKFEVAGKQQTVYNFVQRCCFFQHETIAIC